MHLINLLLVQKHQNLEKPNEDLNEKSIENCEEISKDSNSNSSNNSEHYYENLEEDTPVDKNESINDKDETTIKTIYDPTQWNNLDKSLIDLLVEKCPIRQVLNFLRDENFRRFSTIHYIRKLSNGEKHDRKWLVHSKELGKIFYFCCKLFSLKSITIQLGNEGCGDLKNLSAKLKSHQTNNEHAINMNTWVDAEMRLLKNKTIDKNLQEKINKR